MGKKTIFVICTINVLASAFAIAWVTKPYWGKKPPAMTWGPASADQTSTAPKSVDELWRVFETAHTSDQALVALVALPANEAAASRVDEYRGRIQQDNRADAAAIDEVSRRSAFLLFRGERAAAGTPEHDWLLGYALAKDQPVPEREAALRGVVLQALKQHRAKQAPADAEWPQRLAGYLLENDFGRGSSVEALALQALAALKLENVTEVDRSALLTRLANLLELRNGASEAVVLSALDVARQIEARELLPVIRAVAKSPPSDACAQAAISWLGSFGNADDAAWLGQYRAMTATLHNATAQALAQLKQRNGGNSTVATD